MKRTALSLLMCAACLSGALAQNDAMKVYLKDGDVYTFLKSEIVKVEYSKRGVDGRPNTDYVTQEITTSAKVYYMSLAEIDSVTFVTLFPEEYPVAVDLGLPSGTKWCSCNVGASSPQGSGGYYAWGETCEKSWYDWQTYAYLDSSTGNIDYLGSNISGTQYDVARVLMGEPWQMPTLDQIIELCLKCTWRWTQVKGVNGQLVTGPSGNHIFLPAAGHRWKGDGPNPDNLGGSYWSSTLDENTISNAYDLYLSNDYHNWSNFYTLDYGKPVRAVCR